MHNFSYIYVATNESIPNIVKIGFTRRNPSERMVELDTTGVPTPFDIAFVACLEDAKNLEQLVHRALNSSRVRSDREFFTLSPKDAAQKILSTAATHNIEIFFHKFDSIFDGPLTQNDFSEEKFDLYEKEFFDALITLDSKLIFKKWRLYSGLYDSNKFFEFQSEIDSKYKSSFEIYLKKISLLGNEELDNLFLKELPIILEELDDDQCYDFFYWARSLLRIKKTAHAIALDYFRRAKVIDDFILAATLLYLIGLEDEAYNLYCENLILYYEGRDFKWFAQDAIPLFIFTTINIAKYDQNKIFPIDDYYKSFNLFYQNVDVLNDEKKKIDWMNDVWLNKEIYKWETANPWRKDWMQIAEMTGKFVEDVDFLDRKNFKQLLDDYLVNIFFYTPSKN